jgi:CRP/FNR family transcriptional regulator
LKLVRPLRLDDRKASPRGCFDCSAREHAPWCTLAGDALAALDEVKLLRAYQPGQFLYIEGDPCHGIYCISSGTVALRKAGRGEGNSVVALRHPGETLGYGAFVTDRPHANTAEATSETQVCFIENSRLKSLIEANPSVAHRFVIQMVQSKERAEELLAVCRELPVRARLANTLLALKDRHASVDEQGYLRFELPLSRGHLSSLVGVRPESLSRAIHALEQDGVARFRGREVIVRDLDDLLDEVELHSNTG